MSKRTLHFLLMLLVGIIGCVFYYFFCSSCYTGSKKNTTKTAIENVPAVNQQITTQPTNRPFALSDSKSGFGLNTNEHFNFNANGFSIIKPIAANLDSKILDLKDYLGQHPEKELDVIGLYKSNEENTSAYPNLGIARATAVKNYLVNKGIASKQLNTLGQLDNSLTPNGSAIYQGPVDYKFNTANSVEEENAKIKAELDALKKEILSDPLKLRFQTNSSKLSLSAAQRAKITKLSRYLDKADNGKIVATGHTDNTGNAQANTTLGLSRAETIKDYLTQNGIDATKIITASKGPNQPIATNSTPEGRKENRRVEITLK